MGTQVGVPPTASFRSHQRICVLFSWGFDRPRCTAIVLGTPKAASVVVPGMELGSWAKRVGTSPLPHFVGGDSDFKDSIQFTQTFIEHLLHMKNFICSRTSYLTSLSLTFLSGTWVYQLPTEGPFQGRKRCSALSKLCGASWDTEGMWYPRTLSPHLPPQSPHFVFKIIIPTLVLQGCVGTEYEKTLINCKELDQRSERGESHKCVLFH